MFDFQTYNKVIYCHENQTFPSETRMENIYDLNTRAEKHYQQLDPFATTIFPQPIFN